MSKLQKSILITLGSIIGLMVVLVLIWFFVIWPVTPVHTERYLELGDKLSVEAGDYLDGYDMSLRFAEVDISDVEQDELGSYEVYVTHGSDIYEYTVIVQDTTAPTIVRKDTDVYIAADVRVEPEMLIETVEDISGEVSLEMKEGNIVRKRLTYHELGDYSLTIVATDSSGNVTEEQIDFTVDTAPVFAQIKSVYVTEGSGSDELFTDIQVYDDVDGDLSDEVEMDGIVKWDKEGTYDVTFSVTDQYGLESRETTVVNILPQKEIEELLANREINRKTEIIEGATNLYTAGVGEMDSLDEQMEYMLPVTVHISDLDEQGYGWMGSGFIIDIRDDYIYIASNKHVLKQSGETSDIYFFDGTNAGYEMVGVHDEKDIGIAKVKLEDVEPETLDQLLCVHISKVRNKNIEENDPATLFMQIVEKEGKEYSREGESIGVKDSIFIEYTILRYTVKSVPGNSGSAILDDKGYLVAMNMGYGIEQGDRQKYGYGVLASDVLDFYERITGNKLYCK